MINIKLIVFLLFLNISITAARSSPQSINQSMDIIELNYFHGSLENHHLQINTIIEDLQVNINPQDHPNTIYHILLARALYLRSLITPVSYSITDIFQAILIEEALIPSYRGIDFATHLADQERNLIKELLYSFYKTQARYSFFVEQQMEQALSSLAFSTIFSSNPIFTLYEAAFITTSNPHIIKESDPITELELLLNQATTTILQRTLIYLLLAALLPASKEEYLLYTKSALQAAKNLGEDINQLPLTLINTLPQPMLTLPYQLLNDLILEITANDFS